VAEQDVAHRSNRFRDASGRLRLGWRLASGTLSVVVGLVLAQAAGQLAVRLLGDPGHLTVQAVQAVVMSAVVLPWICLLRLRGDRRSLAGIGFALPLRSAGFFLLGLGLPASIVLVPLAALALGGAATVTVNASTAVLGAVLAWLLVALLLEALPEEIALRGYLFRTLNAVLARWLAALASIGLFVLVPILLALLGFLPGVPSDAFAGGGGLGVDQLVLIAAFGAVLVYLRVVTGSVWTCVGFHLGFLQIGRGTWVGAEDTALFQIHDADTTGVDLGFQLAALAVFALMLAYPWLARRRPGWRERAPE